LDLDEVVSATHRAHAAVAHDVAVVGQQILRRVVGITIVALLRPVSARRYAARERRQLL
jgi:hypothetical protein